MVLDLLTHVREQSDRFATVLRATDPEARVPSCPDWSAADLLWHLGEVHFMWATVVRDRIVDLEQDEPVTPERPTDHAGLLRFYEQQTDDLVEALAAASDETTVWTWAPEQTVGFVRRFQAHEALMHRVDAELAAGLDPTPLPTELADDGIEVALRYGYSWRPGWAEWKTSDAIGLVLGNDTGSRRFVRLGSWRGTSPDTGKTYDGEAALEVLDDAEPTFTVSGAAADLDAWLWGRPGFGSVEFDGAESHLARFREVIGAGMQ